MVDAVITLIKSGSQRQDARGVWRDTDETTREIFARMDSVARTEFFNGGQTGFRPEYRFTVFIDEYQGEDLCEFNGDRYAIYRTYHVPGTDDLELYVKREVGASHGQENGA